jgi:hypothetical protein
MTLEKYYQYESNHRYRHNDMHYAISYMFKEEEKSKLNYLSFIFRHDKIETEIKFENIEAIYVDVIVDLNMANCRQKNTRQWRSKRRRMEQIANKWTKNIKR